MAASHRITAGTGLHKGDRDYQQDQLGIWTHPSVKHCLLAVVADGMGGRSGGRKASDQVLMTAKQLFDRFSPRTESPQQLLTSLVQEAHMVIRMTAVSAEQEPHSTVAAFMITPELQCHWVHAGDSRIYHFRHGRLLHRTRDHSYVQSLVDKGTLTEEQAQNHPKSNVLMGCLGTQTDPPATAHTIQAVDAGDVLMACSDGIWHYFSDTELSQILTRHSAKEACKRLIEVARSRSNGVGDNLSVIVVKFDPLD